MKSMKWKLLALFVLLPMCASAHKRIVKNDDNPLAVIKQTPGMTAIFRRWGFIGDSLCSGEMECYRPGSKNKSYLDLYEYSWGQHLCRLCGAEGYNFSQGGQTAGGWIKAGNDRGWKHAQANPKDAYIIALGVNDMNAIRNGRLQLGDLQTDVRMDDYNQNAQTYAGNMAGIIQRVHSIQPRARIFLVTMPKEDPKKEELKSSLNQVIRQLATMFPYTYVIDLEKHAPLYDKRFKDQYYMLGHLNAAGYLQTAYMFMTYIDWIITHNPSEFTEVGLIGRDEVTTPATE